MILREPVFAVCDVRQIFGSVCALDQVSLDITAGERVALLGPSGAGKSTLLSLLNGTLAPTHGTVRVLGQDLGRLRPAARRAVQRQIGTIYQQFALVDSLRVIHNVNAGHLGRWSLFKALVSLVWPLEVERALWALEQVGIPDKLYTYMGQLSGGQQQRAALARILVQDPHAILADEPISNLDPQRGREIIDLLCTVCRQTGKTLVASLHAVEFAFSHFERIIGLREGRVFFDRPVQAVDATLIDALYQITRRDGPEQDEAGSRGGP